MPLDVTQSITSTVFPLTAARQGAHLRIARFTAGRALARRLADMGLPLGSEVEVMHRHPSGRVVVARGHTRMALGAGMSSKILVAPADG